MRFFFKRGDTKKTLIVPLARDITGCTVKLVLSLQGVIVLEDIVTISDAVNGVVEYPIGNFSLETGLYKGEFEITFPDSKVEIFPKISQIFIDIIPSLSGIGGGTTPPIPSGVIDGGGF